MDFQNGQILGSGRGCHRRLCWPSGFKIPHPLLKVKDPLRQRGEIRHGCGSRFVQ
jgi:hypothetical protein